MWLKKALMELLSQPKMSSSTKVSQVWAGSRFGMDLEVGEKERLNCRAVVEINWLLLWVCCFSHPSWVKGNSGKI